MSRPSSPIVFDSGSKIKSEYSVLYSPVKVVKAGHYLLTTTPSSHNHRFHPLSTIVIHTSNLCKVQSMDDNCGEWVECMGVASGCGEQMVGVASGSGWILRV